MLVLLVALACSYSGDPFTEQGGLCGALIQEADEACAGAGCRTVLCAPGGFASCPEGQIEDAVLADGHLVEELMQRCEDGGWNWEEVAGSECPTAGNDDALIVACMQTYPPG